MATIAKKSPPPQRPTLGLRGVAPKAIRPPKSPVAPAVPVGTQQRSAPVLPEVPNDAPVSFVNWRVGFRRPTCRYLSREAALREARRLRESAPGAVVHTYRLELITEDAP